MSIKVFFNNSCSICRFEINHYKKCADRSLEWIDITNNNEALQLTKKSMRDLLRRVHVIHNGEVVEGARAFLIIWSKIPKYRILYKFARLPIIYHAGWLIYEFIALLLYVKNKNLLRKVYE